MKKEMLPIRSFMNCSQAMVEFYNIFSKLEGSNEARELISMIISNEIAMFDFEGQSLDPIELENRILNHLNDYIEVAKKTHAA